MQAHRNDQRGISFIGLLLAAIVIGFIGLIGLRVLPTVTEYSAISRTVDKLAASGIGSVPEIRNAFDRQKSVEYGITSISGKDLTITKQNDRVVIGFAYDKEIELVSPVWLLIKYEGRSK